MRFKSVLVAAFTLFVASGCGDDAVSSSAPAPGELTRDAIGYYCNMIVADHEGPKGHIFIHGKDEPVWFSSVRDTIAFTMLPEEPRNIAAIYVNDMGRASWENPESDTWIHAQRAWYVIESDAKGGMGAPEPVPFAEEQAARAFATERGGQVVRFDDVPPEVVIAPVADGAAREPASPGVHGAHGHGSMEKHK
jgi:copper chaperone NosL